MKKNIHKHKTCLQYCYISQQLETWRWCDSLRLCFDLESAHVITIEDDNLWILRPLNHTHIPSATLEHTSCHIIPAIINRHVGLSNVEGENELECTVFSQACDSLKFRFETLSPVRHQPEDRIRCN
jgi:hypothetical protein